MRLRTDALPRPRHLRRLGAAVLTLTAAWALTGCVPEGSVAGTTATPLSPSATEEAPNFASPEPEPTPVALTPQACLTGTWLADNALFFAAIGQYGDEFKSVTGEVFVTYGPGGALETEYREWELTAVAEGITVTIHRTGTDTGEYTASGSTLSFGDTQMGSVLTLTGQGLNMTIDPEPAIYTDVPYTCGPTTLTMIAEGNEVSMARQ